MIAKSGMLINTRPINRPGDAACFGCINRATGSDIPGKLLCLPYA